MIDFQDIAGHESAKRAIEIAVAGGLGLSLYGANGSGATILNKAKGDLAKMCNVALPVGENYDMRMMLEPVDLALALADIKQETSAEVAKRILEYHKRNPQATEWPVYWRPKLGHEFPVFCKKFLIESTAKVEPRHLLSIYKVAKTIQGLAGTSTVRIEHVAEAVQYVVRQS